jgi:tRNA threonylcarbamoyladenosine biosynthesis protein TsaE
MSERLILATTGADQTRSLARAMAHLCVPGDIVLLAGDLGAGKTTFAQGFGAGLGIDEVITSPTFTLVRQYPVERATGPDGARAGIRTLLHADVYRLDHLAEIADLGLG